jgi:hypothetical protein
MIICAVAMVYWINNWKYLKNGEENQEYSALFSLNSTPQPQILWIMKIIL